MSLTIIECDGKRYKMVGFRSPREGEYFLNNVGCVQMSKRVYLERPILLPLEEEPPQDAPTVGGDGLEAAHG